MSDVLDDIVNEYNNTVHKTIKMKPIDVTSDSYAEYNESSDEKDSKFKVGDRVRTSKYKKFLLRDILKISQFLSLAKLKIQFYVIIDLNGEPIAESFSEKELQKPSRKV